VIDPSPPAGPPAAWYPDPTGRYEHRFYNGRTWTADVSRAGVRGFDPLGVEPAPAEPHHDRRATAALVLGVVAATTAWMPFLFVVGVVCAVLAICFGVAAMRRRPRDRRGFAAAGLVLGAVAVPLAAVGVWLSAVVLGVVDRYLDPPSHAIELTTCAVDGGVGTPATLHVAGTITNTDDHAGAFRVRVEATIGGGRRERLVFELEPLPAGHSMAFERTEPLTAYEADGTAPQCEVTDVTGPLPFGVDVE
jgi:hypothetical protein